VLSIKKPIRPLATSVTRILSNLTDLVLPRLCLVCSAILAQRQLGICSDCLPGLPAAGAPRCQRCALLVSGRGPLCAHCQLRTPILDQCLAMADYRPPLDRIIQALKFQQQWALGVPLGAALGLALSAPIAMQMAHARDSAENSASNSVPAGAGGWLLCPIPLSSQRLRERGFNQSQLIAKGLRAGLLAGGVPDVTIVRPLLHRVRDTKPQSTLNSTQRQDNVRQAFAVSSTMHGRCQGARIVLIDDVMTTGATLNSAALTLKQAGAAWVCGVIVARAP
jgi:ComF family protein